MEPMTPVLGLAAIAATLGVVKIYLLSPSYLRSALKFQKLDRYKPTIRSSLLRDFAAYLSKDYFGSIILIEDGDEVHKIEKNDSYSRDEKLFLEYIERKRAITDHINWVTGHSPMLANNEVIQRPFAQNTERNNLDFDHFLRLEATLSLIIPDSVSDVFRTKSTDGKFQFSTEHMAILETLPGWLNYASLVPASCPLVPPNQPNLSHLLKCLSNALIRDIWDKLFMKDYQGPLPFIDEASVVRSMYWSHEIIGMMSSSDYAPQLAFTRLLSALSGTNVGQWDHPRPAGVPLAIWESMTSFREAKYRQLEKFMKQHGLADRIYGNSGSIFKSLKSCVDLHIRFLLAKAAFPGWVGVYMLETGTLYDIEYSTKKDCYTQTAKPFRVGFSASPCLEIDQCVLSRSRIHVFEDSEFQ